MLSLQKLTRRHDLIMYACALLSFLVVAAGGIGGLIVILFALGWVGSWVAHQRGWSQRVDARVWNAIILVIVLFTGVQMYASDDSIINIGVRFITLLLILKLFSRQGGERDDWQIYALTFLLMAAGTAINEDVTYGVLFALYVPLSTFGLAMLHLRTETARERRVTRNAIARIYTVALVVLAGAVFLSSVGIFFAFPRVGLGFFATKTRASMAMTGFSDKVELGSHGVIRDNPDVALRVEFEGVEGMPAEAEGYHWRMMSFDTYDGVEWSRGKRNQPRNLQTEYETRTFDLTSLYTEELNELSDARGGGRTIRVYREPLGANQAPQIWPAKSLRLPMAIPLPFNPKLAWLRGDPFYGDIYIQQRNELGIFYDLEVRQPPPASEMTSRTFDDPEELEALAPFLQLPEGMERLEQLSAQVTQGANTPYERAAKIIEYLNANYTYTTNLPPVDPNNPVESFLFDTKSGHCEFFATSMTLMLRASGVPARLVNGFLGGVWNPAGGYMAVRQGDAHSWVEVYIPDLGWVTFDPTPADGTQPTRADGLMNFFRNSYDAARMSWMKWVIEYDLDTQIDGLRRLGQMLSPRGGGSSRSSGESDGADKDDGEGETLPVRDALIWGVFLGLCGISWRAGRRRRGRKIGALIIAPVAAAAGGVLFWTAAGAGWIGWFWEFDVAPTLGGAAGPLLTGVLALTVGRTMGLSRAEVASGLFADLEREARKLGVERRDDEGPNQFIERLARRFPDAARDLRFFASRYLAARFGGQELSPETERALRQTLRRIRDAMRSGQ